MSGIPQITKTGPASYTPASGETIHGGVLVEARSGGRIGVAAAASVHVLGVALFDAIAPEQVNTSTTTDSLGRPVLTAVAIPTTVAVAYGGVEVKLTYSAAANFGDLLVATANGQVAPAAATPDVRTIVGRCTEPAGVAAAGVGRARIN